MPRQEVHLSDIGTTFLVTVTDDEVAVNLATATLLKIYLKSPSATKTKDATLYTDGSDGKIYYVAESGDIDVAGEWEIQAGFTLNGWAGRSSVEKFEVHANL